MVIYELQFIHENIVSRKENVLYGSCGITMRVRSGDNLL